MKYGSHGAKGGKKSSGGKKKMSYAGGGSKSPKSGKPKIVNRGKGATNTGVT